MTDKRDYVPFCCLFAAVLLLSQSQAHAYIDPGTGSIVLQALLAGILGAAMAVKIFWHKIKASCATLFGRRKDDQDK